MTAWTAFASVAGVVTALLLLLSHATSKRLDDPQSLESTTPKPRGEPMSDETSSTDDGTRRDQLSTGDRRTRDTSPTEEGVAREAGGVRRPFDEPPARNGAGARSDSVIDDRSEGYGEGSSEGDDRPEAASGRDRVEAREFRDDDSFSQPALLLNVALSQGVFGVVLVAAAVAAAVPPAALGLGSEHLGVMPAVAGVVLGVGLYVADEVGESLAEAAGLGQSQELRELLAPESALGWLVLLGGVLPIVAGFEELLFRGVLVGAFATGFDVSPWLLVVASSVIFGLGHGAQGRLGVVVTSALGVVLGVAFVVSGSLLLVVVAHYLVNALEFVVHEGLDVDWMP